MSPNPAIPRELVHRLSEECAEQAATFQTVARRILEDQARLTRFFKANVQAMQGQSGEVSVYLLAVIVRIYQKCGGRLGRVGATEIEAATQRVMAVGKGLMPGDDGFPTRVRAIEWRAQPHILDEALHALFEREEKKAAEVDVADDQAALIFFMLWAATEALNDAWQAPTDPDWAA